ncbi:glycine-rich protein DOT1 [Folsomia candida]|uniref:Uncharacterized protein n=1 Tax=Folsomia candida TaxID=158441 RepID=A0A226DNZ8_FOLCA|nr:glycine-rich protein DOT1 [Folsomia candida]OXA46341.1 hypothetical protein Fcan01_18626 [Folsomia candida]
MKMASHRDLTVLAAITTLAVLAVVTKAETNFASSSIASDGSGTRSSQFVGTIPNGGGGIGTRISSPGGGGSGITVVSGSGPGNGQGGAVFTGSSSNGGGGGGGGGTVGIFSRTGPSGTQHTVIGPSGTRVYNQPPTGRFGGSGSSSSSSSGPDYTYPMRQGYYNDFYDYYNSDGGNGGYYNYPPPAVAVAGPFGAGASAGGVGTFAGTGSRGGGSGAFAGAGSPDYFG